MKKILFSLFALFFALCFTSCNDQAADSTESSIEEICNIPITSVEDFSLSDGKYEMIGECKMSDDSSKQTLQDEWIFNINTVDSERIVEEIHFYGYAKIIYYTKSKYEEAKADCIENEDIAPLDYEYDDESLTINGTYMDVPVNYFIESLKDKIKSILSGEQEGSVKMNEDKTAFFISYTDPMGDATFTITKQD
jgi:hypothetical protein